MDHLREDGDEAFGDLLPERFRQLTPEVLGFRNMTARTP